MQKNAPAVLPLITVVIPAYNHEKYVREAIYSILEQTYPNIELLVVDDGSSDRTWKTIQEMEPACRARLTAISFATQKNQGICATLNSMFKAAGGDYIFYLGSDDIAKPDAIRILYDYMSGDPECALAVGDNMFIDDDGQLYPNQAEDAHESGEKYARFSISFRPYLDLNSDGFGKYLNLLMNNHVPNGYLMRSSVVKRITLPEGFPLEDYYLHLQIAKVAEMKYIDKVLYLRRVHQTNISNDGDVMQDLCYRTFWLEVETVRKSKDERLIAFIDKFIDFRRNKMGIKD